MMNEEITNRNVPVDSLHIAWPGNINISVSMLRLDLVHPMISGNKIFKLHYFLEEAKKSRHKLVITFGGSYSNHLAASSFTCYSAGLKSIGIVRGEMPEKLSHTLQFCLQNKMHLEFVSRTAYNEINGSEFKEELTKKYGEHTLIPEGGFSIKGAKGAALIYHHFNQNCYSHICCPVGTATTFAGLINAGTGAKIIGFPVLKNLTDINARLKTLGVTSLKDYNIIEEYHFGGYAKKNNELISFMNSFYDHNKIPLDFVYTGKMMFGLYDLIKKNYFPRDSKIVCIHTGGLQGNQSLPNGMLNF